MNNDRTTTVPPSGGGGDSGSDGPFDPNNPNSWPRVPGYRLTGFIGGGGHSLVFSTDQEVNGRPVAVKVPRVPLSQDAMSRLRDEYKILCELPEHPGLAKVFFSHVCNGPGIWKGVPFYSLENVRGDTLDTFLKPDDPRRNPTLRQRLALFEKICRAAHAAHVSAIHCDLKPPNIIIESETDNPKIIDFGVARRIVGEEAAADLFGPEREGVFGGTIPYMSPEQLARFVSPRMVQELLSRQERDSLAVIGPESDVYALGVILFEAISGRRPFEEFKSSPDRNAYAKAVLKQPPPRPEMTVQESSGERHQRTPDLGLRWIVRKSLCKQPQHRFRSAAALALAIGMYRAAAAPLILFRGSGRLLTALLIALVVMVLGRWIGVPLVTTWTDASLRYQQWMLTGNPIHRAPNVLDAVRMIVIEDRTDFEALASNDTVRLARVENGLDKAYTRRAVYGWFLKRLADEGIRPKVVAFDFTFPSNPDAEPFDRILGEGVDALMNRGIPVVVGLWDWPRQQLQATDICDAIRDKVMFGGVTVDNRAGTMPWLVHAALKPAGGTNVLPGISLAAVSLTLEPDWIPTISSSFSTGVIELRFERPRSTPSLTLNNGPPPRKFRASRVDFQETDNPLLGVKKGDEIAGIEIDLPTDLALSGATIPLQRAANASASELKQWLDGKVIVFGNVRSDAKDHFNFIDRGMRFGVVGHAVAIGSMLSGPFLKSVTLYSVKWFLFAAGLSGALPVLLPNRRWTRIMPLLLAVLLAWAACTLVCYYSLDLLIDPWLQGLGVIAGAVFASLVAAQLDAVLLLRERVA